jgi:hypothetical protein
VVKHIRGRGTSYETTIDYNTVIGSHILMLMASECPIALNEIEDLMSLSSRSQDVINFYHEFIHLSFEDTQKVYVDTQGQNNVTWRKFRQVIFSSFFNEI